MKQIAPSELLLNANNTLYHLHVNGDNIADTIILVGDPGRVKEISKHFDTINFTASNREITTHTGEIGGKRLTVLSTGMGTDNLDIVINELDAAANIDLAKRVLKDKYRKLNLIRMGTSGALQADIEPGTMVASSYGVGLDGLLYFYKQNNEVNEMELAKAFVKHTSWNANLPGIYAVKASECLLNRYAKDLIKGITLTAPGFYAPQGRELRLKLAFPEINSLVENFYYENDRITNFEMETSALYALGKMLGHETLTICTIVANRVSQKNATDYHKDVEKMINLFLEKFVQH